MLAAGVSEAGEVIARRKSARQALKGTMSRAVKRSIRWWSVRKKKTRGKPDESVISSSQSQKSKPRKTQKKSTRPNENVIRHQAHEREVGCHSFQT